MKLKIVLKKTKVSFEKIKATNAWQKMFVHQINEEKMREFQNQARLKYFTMRNF